MAERVAGLVGAEALSIGDFVLAGGDVAALVVIEAVARLVPGVLGNLDSLAEESFTGGLLEYPQYTRPAEIGGLKVPEVLLSGDHRQIARWRRQQRLRRTFEQRPDLIDAAIDAGELSDSERDLVAAWRALLSSNSRPFTSRE
jgi:tRNA (guanine37-N1)-methyltransferase